MTIEVRGHLAATALLTQQPGHWDGIFIIDSNHRPSQQLTTLTRRCLVLSFDDIESPITGKIPPMIEHVNRAIEFSREGEQLLISCRAGQSRSAALALLIFANRSDVDSAMAFLDPSRHRPNRKLVHLGADLIDQPFLPTALDHWYETLTVSLDLALFDAEIRSLTGDGVVNLISCPKYHD